MPFYNTYDFIGLKNSKKRFVEYNLPDTYYFVREIHADETICDEYCGESLVNKHVVVPHFSNIDYELKTIPATFKIREYNPITKKMTDNPQIFYTAQDACDAGLLAPKFAIWSVEIICDADYRSFGIDPDAPWPPTGQ